MWIFIAVPPAESALAKQAGAQLHRKSGQWFFDDTKYQATDFARWPRIPTPDSAHGKKATTQEPVQASLSLHEVASLTGHTSKVIRALIEAGRFPRPMAATGISARSDKWALGQVQEWLASNGFGALARVVSDEAKAPSKDDETNHASFYAMADIAKELGITPWQRVFAVLRAKNVLIDSEDPALANRPTDQYMKTGWFGRVERYLPAREQMIYQTVVTAAGHKHVLDLLRDATGEQ